MPRILFVTSRRASFIEVDRELLSRRYEVHELHQPGGGRTPCAYWAPCAAARERVLHEFSLDARAGALNGLIDRALHGR